MGFADLGYEMQQSAYGPASSRGDRGSTSKADRDGRGTELCRALLGVLPVTGASISVANARGDHLTVGTSDELAAELTAWQFQSGVGPHWEAMSSEEPVLIHDTAAPSWTGAWPSTILGAVPEDTGALFAFPLRLGPAVVGVVDLYCRARTDPWSDRMVQSARRVTRGVSHAAVHLATRAATAATTDPGQAAPDPQREIQQATGMVMAQLNGDAATALLRLRGQAYVSEMRLSDVAHDVIARRINFATL